MTAPGDAVLFRPFSGPPVPARVVALYLGDVADLELAVGERTDTLRRIARSTDPHPFTWTDTP